MAKLVSLPYATALFEIAKEQNATEAFAKQVNVVLEVLEQNKQILELLLHPKVTQDEKITLIDTIFQDKVIDEITGMLTIVVYKGRQSVIIDILNEFLAMVNEHLGIVKATVTTAVELNTKQLSQIKDKIQSTTEKDIELEAVVDASIIGGMVIRVGDNVVDASIAGRLRELKEGLTKLRLA